MNEDGGKIVRSGVFSVMETRPDLPSMTLPLAVLMTAAVIMLSCVCASLADTAEDFFALKNVPGTAAAFLMLPAASAAYSLIILLWRRYSSLLVAPIAFASMLFCGRSIAVSAAVSLTVLFTSYVYAVMLIGRDGRRKRLILMSGAYAVTVFLCALSAVALRFGSMEVFIAEYMERVPKAIDALVEAMNGGETVLTADSKEIAGDLLIMLPSLIGAAAFAAAGLTEILTAVMFHVLSCEGTFMKEGDGFRVSAETACVYCAAFLMFLFTSKTGNPLLYAMLRSVVYLLALPCAVCGIAEAVERLEDSLLFSAKGRFTAFIIAAVGMGILGFIPFCTVFGFIGAIGAVRRRIRAKKDGGSE